MGAVDEAVDSGDRYWKDRSYNSASVAETTNVDRAISPAYGSARMSKAVAQKKGRAKLADMLKYTSEKKASARSALLTKLASGPEDEEIIEHSSIESAVEDAQPGDELVVPEGLYDSTLPYDMEKQSLPEFMKEAGFFADLGKRLAGRAGGIAAATNRSTPSLLAKGLAAKAGKVQGKISTGIAAGNAAASTMPRRTVQQLKVDGWRD